MKCSRAFTAKLSLLLILAAVSACAKQGYPSGGPKDKEPPKNVGCKPDNAMRNFDRHQFYIEFDEYVVLKDAENNVLVSPPLKYKAAYSTKGRGVQVKLKDTLQENTTYLFQFKGAIADYTEGNVLPTFEYVFSTGDAMDTMMLAGRVLSARNGKPWGGALSVSAYREEHCTTDTMGCSTQPDFVTRTDDSGYFAFHYIPAGRYRLVAFEDMDRNLRVGNAEAVAWNDMAYAAADSVDSTAMPLLLVSAPDKRRQRVLKSDFTARGVVSIVTVLPMQAPQLSGEDVQWRLNGRRDTMTVWCLDKQCDSTVLVISDSATGLGDTLRLRHRSRGKVRGFAQGSQRLQVVPLCDGTKAYYDDLRLSFRTPVVEVREGAAIEVMREKDSSIREYPVILDSSGIAARIEATLVSGEQYSVHLPDSLFVDMYGNYSDSLDFTMKPKDYGTLTLHIDNAVGRQLVVEVLDSRDTVVQHKQLIGSGTLQFIHLPAAEYRLRAVVDENADGCWTPADYRRQRQPEECIFFDKTLRLREKWEMEEKWRIVHNDRQ